MYYKEQYREYTTKYINYKTLKYGEDGEPICTIANCEQNDLCERADFCSSSTSHTVPTEECMYKGSNEYKKIKHFQNRTVVIKCVILMTLLVQITINVLQQETIVVNINMLMI